jgi:type IV secretory pathway protease TraF
MSSRCRCPFFARRRPHALSGFQAVVWNASASVSIWLYKVHRAHHLTVTALAVAYPPEPLAGWLAQGRYLPLGVPLLKPFLATDGETVCRVGRLITVDGRETGVTPENDHSGRPLRCPSLLANLPFLQSLDFYRSLLYSL